MLARNILKYLNYWKNKESRKVLLLRGARQVGKTFIVRELGKAFKRFIELNLVAEPRIAALFSQGSLEPDGIIEAIGAFKGVPVVDGETLLFIDEIQASPEAITALRFFYEKRPNLHVIASGSLLDFAIENTPSFGVGRIEYLYMYPLTFNEFLLASKEELLLSQIQKATPFLPLAEVLHHKALRLFKEYLCIGGMPEIVSEYLNKDSSAIAANNSTRLQQVSFNLGNIITGYSDDFSKYKKRLKIEYIEETFRSTALQAGKKFVFSHAFRDANSKVVHQSLDFLVKAGVVHKVYHTSANDGAALNSECDYKKFKTIPHDIGLFNRLSGIHLGDIALLDPLELIHKGSLAEVSCGLALLWEREPYTQDPLFYWHREAKSSNAEVDYVVGINDKVVPVEVKASGKGAMHSLRIFLKEKGIKHGARISTENFGIYDDIITIPLYAVSELSRVMASVFE
jgi:predicted AAA+ superfamily ATPase